MVTQRFHFKRPMAKSYIPSFHVRFLGSKPWHLLFVKQQRHSQLYILQLCSSWWLLVYSPWQLLKTESGSQKPDWRRDPKGTHGYVDVETRTAWTIQMWLVDWHHMAVREGKSKENNFQMSTCSTCCIMMTGSQEKINSFGISPMQNIYYITTTGSIITLF